MAVKKARSARPKARAGKARPGASKKPAPVRTTKPAAAKPASGAKPAATANKPAASAIGVLSLSLDYTSHDVAGIKRFYGETLGFKCAVDPNAGYVAIHTTPTTMIGFMAPEPIPPEQWRPPGEPSLYFFVENVDRAHRVLVAKGVSFQKEPTDMPWGHRLAICRDPEGRMICLAQDLSRRDT